MSASIAIISKIKGKHNALNYRLFKMFWNEFGSEQSERWFTVAYWHYMVISTRGNSLLRLFEMRIKEATFLETYIKISQQFIKRFYKKDIAQN